MKKTKWYISILAIVVALTLCFAGCKKEAPTTAATDAPDSGAKETSASGVEGTSSGLSTDPVTINFWNSWTGSDGTLLDTIVEFYNNNNTDGVTIVMDRMQRATLTEKMAAALLSNTAPALSIQQAAGDYAANGQLVAIDDIFDRTDLDRDDFIPAVLDQCYLNGKLYGLPFQLSSTFLYWNKDLFEAAGLDPETPPKTWDEMYEMGMKISDPDNNIYGGGFYLNNGMFIDSVCISNGGGFVGGSAEEGFTSLFTDPSTYEANLESLNWYKKMLDDGVVPAYQQDENVAMFLAGTCAMMTNGGWMVAGCNDNNLNWGISLLPAGSKGIAQVGFPMSLVVMKGTEGRELEACYQFMTYWQNNKTQTLQEKSPAMQWALDLGYQPYLYSVANDEKYLSNPVANVTSKYVDHYENVFPNEFPMFMVLMFNIVNPMDDAIVAGSATVEEALATAQMQFEDALSGN